MKILEFEFSAQKPSLVSAVKNQTIVGDCQNIFAVLHVFLSTVVFVAFRVERVCPFPNFFVWLSTFSLRPSFQLSNDEGSLVNPAFLLNLGALPVPPFDLEQGDADCCCEKDSKAD